MKASRFTIAAVALTAACSGPQTSDTAALAADGVADGLVTAQSEAELAATEAAALLLTEGWLSEAATQTLPTFELGDQSWLQLEDVPAFQHPLFPEDLAARWSSSDGRRQRTSEADIAGPVRETVTLVTSEGLCVAELGPPTWVDRGDCVDDAALAQEIIGCEGERAPLGWVLGQPPADAVWAPVDLVESWEWLDNSATVPTLRSNAGFALLAAYESEFLADLLEAGNRPSDVESAAMMGWAFGGGEMVSLIMAAAHTLDDNCDDWTATYVTVGFEVDQGWRTVADDFVLTGVIAQEDRIVALVSNSTHSLQVLKRDEGYDFTEVINTYFWFENSECIEPWTPVSFETLCAP